MKQLRKALAAVVLATTIGGATMAFANSLSVTPKSLTVNTTGVSVPKATGNLTSSADQASATPGAAITAKATVANLVNPTGTLSYTLIAGPTPPATCSVPAGASTVTVNGNADYTLAATAGAAGTYWWYVTYSGDANNAPASGACGDNANKVAVGSTSMPTMHLSNIRSFNLVRQNKNFWSADIEVSVVGPSGPVPSVTVSGTWTPAPVNGTPSSCMTSTNGTCTMTASSNAFSTPDAASETWTVTGLVASGYVYDSAANVMNSITVLRPAS